MAKGYYLFRGDKTACGGKIIDGYTDHQFFDKDMACEGHRVTCGKHEGLYRIAGGLDTDDIHGKRIAGTLHSRSSCPCKSRLIPSNWDDDYDFTTESAEENLGLSQIASLPKLPEPIQHAQVAKKHNDYAKTCTPDDNPLRDGVYIWVEVQETGHAFVSVHISNEIFVYTYGRFGRVGTAGLTGDGILLFMKGDDARLYYREELYQREAVVYKINDVGLFSAKSEFKKLWDLGTIPLVTKDMGERTKRNGRVIDEYDLTGSNCTTHTVNAINKAGSHVFDTRYISTTTGIPIEGHEDFTIPTSLKKYLSEKSRDLESMNVIDFTSEFKKQYPNINGFTPTESNFRGKAFEAATEGLSEAGSSTGYSAGSIGGLTCPHD
ncbi:PAAR domain-containing protein [Enterobacter cloacae]|uniref:Pyocin large subunit n=1 Tax=Enterobacter cloacae TaxID=550 RepID=A0A144VBY4_ENTCL|nr:PAAR domain-containing protein [Enterobacter cloacae]CZW49191.1 Pyocin large subunit [Enterobacter cloacae]SAH89607.1 Pyocin large subunit [Enterobacter cloacae]